MRTRATASSMPLPTTKPTWRNRRRPASRCRCENAGKHAMTLPRRTLLQAASAAAVLGAAGARPLRAQGAPVKIGAMLPMSGIGAEAGTAWLNGIKAAQLQWNANGGLLGRQIEIVVRDDKFTSAGAVNAVRELAGEGVNLS